MERTWPVHDAKARFSELLECSLRDGPQIVTRRGQKTAVVVPFHTWERIQAGSSPSLKALLLADSPRSDELAPPRSRHLGRHPVRFD